MRHRRIARPLPKDERLRTLRFTLQEIPYTIRALDNILARANAILRAERGPKTVH